MVTETWPSVSPDTIAEREKDIDATRENEGLEWVKAHPEVVRVVLAAYQHRGKTVLMSRDEFSGAGRQYHG